MVDETVSALKQCEKVKLAGSGHSPLVDVPDILTDKINNFLN